MGDISDGNKIETNEEFRFVLVGNIIDKHYYGVDKEIRSGSKHFRAGAKVYLLPLYGGNGHENIPVYGLPRKSKRKIEVVIRIGMIKNVRVKKTFDPKIIEKMKDSNFYSLDDSAESLKQFVDYFFNKANMEIE